MKNIIRKVEIVCIPELLPGETLLSHLVRSALLNSAYIHHIASTYFDRPFIKYSFSPPRNLEAFVAATSGILGDADSIIENHTIFPAIRPFLSDSQRVATHQMLHHNGVNDPVSRVRSWAGPKPGIMKWCLSCVEDDERYIGFTYWRREHQFASATRCLIHDTPLIRECGCGGLFRRPVRTFLPSRTCICGRQPRVVVSTRGLPPGHVLESRVHETLRDLLYDPVPESHYPFVVAAIQQGADDNGLFTQKGRLLTKLKDYTSKFGAPDFFDTPTWLGGCARSIPGRLARGHRASDANFNVEAISVLFPDSGSFRKALNERFTRNAPAEDMWATRQVNGQMSPEHARKLRAGRVNHAQQCREQLDQDSVIIIQANIDREMNSKLRPVRISKCNMLLGCKSQIMSRTEEFPKSAKLLAENYETQREYGLRTARWLLETEAWKYQSEGEMINAIAFTTSLKTDDLKRLVIDVQQSLSGLPWRQKT
jgi:hypothetical protein